MVQGGRTDGPLVSWRWLLEHVAKQERVPCDVCMYDSLPLLWEAIVTASVRRHKRRAAHDEEQRLRKRVAAILKIESAAFRHAYHRSRWMRDFVQALKVRPTHIIDLNFDHLLPEAFGCCSRPQLSVVRNIKRSGIRVEDARNMVRRWNRAEGNITVWKPHGWIGTPSSIRLGARDYGLQLAAYYLGFQRFKQVERSTHAMLEVELGRWRPASVMSDADTWITRFMAYETDMIGVGMISDEWALRWLCAQRDRNGARHSTRPLRWHLCSPVLTIPGVACVGHGTWGQAWQAVTGGVCDTGDTAHI